jgi:hypothetical protein
MPGLSFRLVWSPQQPDTACWIEGLLQVDKAGRLASRLGQCQAGELKLFELLNAIWS